MRFEKQIKWYLLIVEMWHACRKRNDSWKGGEGPLIEMTKMQWPRCGERRHRISPLRRRRRLFLAPLLGYLGRKCNYRMLNDHNRAFKSISARKNSVRLKNEMPMRCEMRFFSFIKSFAFAFAFLYL